MSLPLQAYSRKQDASGQLEAYSKDAMLVALPTELMAHGWVYTLGTT